MLYATIKTQVPEISKWQKYQIRLFRFYIVNSLLVKRHAGSVEISQTDQESYLLKNE